MAGRLFSRKSRNALLFSACAAVILAITWLYIRDDLRLQHYGENASEAYVVFYKPQPTCIQLDSRGSKKLVELLLEETAARQAPSYSALILAKVIFVGKDGSPTLSCSLPSPKESMSAEDVVDYWEKKIENIETAVQVPYENVSGKLDETELFFLRRRSKM
ncbi:hypothetical protein [Posidoniimonas corsicana]|nr:hypothetical protein [Posidoniimonas corsicana]